MLRKLVVCGLLAGACAGLVATGVGAAVGEPPLARAVAFAAAAAPPEGGSDVAVVSREVQSGPGLLSAMLIYAVAMGGLFALSFALGYGRIGSAAPAATALWLSAGAFIVLFLVPFLEYPANPPGVGDPSTIAERTLLHATMVAISITAALAALRTRAAVASRASAASATLAGVAVYIVLVVVASFLLPVIDEIPAGFPATTLWDFRLASIGVQAALWATLGGVFALTAQRAMTGLSILPRATRSGRPAEAARGESDT